VRSELPWQTSSIDLPPHLEEMRRTAKQLARDSRYDKALEYNVQLAEKSRAQKHALGEVIGLRFAGVCEYRRERYVESEGFLVQARERACAGDFHQQQLHIANHLGATLRRLGRFDEARDTLFAGLDEVRLPKDLEAKARLLGNLGALYDEIGNERGADDCYARYEELIALLVYSGDTDDGARLANARALAARAALRRGDLEAAKRKHDDEFQLAHTSQDQLRIRNAILHRAKIHLELGLRAQRETQDPSVDFNVAITEFRLAQKLFEKEKHQSRIADIWHHRGRLYEAMGQWAEAYGAFTKAWSIACEKKYLYRQAESSLALARFCQLWALHGESLHWFREAARIHCEQYAPLATSKRIAGLAQARVAELYEVAKKLADESRRVEREESESNEINKLVKEITRKTIHELAGTTALESVHDWQKRIRHESVERWKELLSPERFAQLKPQSQDDLVMADVLYHGVVDELPRSALLIAIVAEREMRERVFVPIHEAYASRRTGEKLSWSSGRPPATIQYLYQDRSDNVPIGNAFRMLREIFGKRIRHRAVDFARDMTRRWHDKLKLVVRLNDAIRPVGLPVHGIPFSDLRNAAAHGGDGAAKLDRMTVDAMKRRLVLESPMILATILDVDLRHV